MINKIQVIPDKEDKSISWICKIFKHNTTEPIPACPEKQQCVRCGWRNY